MIRPAPAPRCPSADALSSQASVRECLRVAERRRVAIRGMSVLSVPKVCCLPKQAGTLTRAAFLVHRLHFAGFHHALGSRSRKLGPHRRTRPGRWAHGGWVDARLIAAAPALSLWLGDHRVGARL